MLKEFLRNWSPRADAADQQRQAGAIPYAVVDGQVVFLLVTARHSGRWIFPKGALSKSRTPWETAAREAREEAGVSGEVAQQPIGSYRTSSGDGQRSLAEVDMFPLLVTEQHDEWPEMAERHRHWVILPEARRLLAYRRLAALAEALSRQVLTP
ncbi:MAG TPA: NUDIX hydrolase [Devosiaceae bacterium]|nr:NUDIX hydrolase [Devosiaceae bacterium]